MKTLIITTALALGVGFFSTASFAAGYVVNGHAASPIEAQLLVADGVQPGTWVINGYGIAPAEHASFISPPTSKPCCYVLDVLFCD